MLAPLQQISDDDGSIAILLVEDEPLVRLVLTDLLADAGYRVTEAGNADEAMTLLESRPDMRVIITDVRMPGTLDGFALARFAADRRPGIGIVVTSGNALPRSGDLPEGAAFLPKPWRPSELVERVRRLLEGS